MLAITKITTSSAAHLRVCSFATLMVAAALFGALLGLNLPYDPVWLGVTILAVPYVGWIVTDLRARDVHGAVAVIELLVALVPGSGLLVYLVVTRRLTGLL